MTEHIIHTELPEGFHFADRNQARDFERTGSINGASKVCLVQDGTSVRVATRLRPPRDRGEVYISEYRAGWQEAKAKPDGIAPPYRSQAASDGWLDFTWGRMKWHLAYCEAHHNANDGCGVQG